ncbi:MAG: tyrosine-type recombinase/integrase [Anaerolineae bacterium]
MVFASERGTHLDAGTLRDVFARVCRAASLPTIRPYDLRHTSASLLLALGTHPKVVSERLGHSNVSLTLTTYSHVLPGLQRDASESLEAALRPVRASS